MIFIIFLNLINLNLLLPFETADSFDDPGIMKLLIILLSPNHILIYVIVLHVIANLLKHVAWVRTLVLMKAVALVTVIRACVLLSLSHL